MLFGMASCSNDLDVKEVQGKEVKMTVRVEKQMLDEGTRTSLTENEGSLDCAWTKGDKLVVTNADGGRLGVLTLEGEGGEENATFSGSVRLSGEKAVLNYIYLGQSKTANTDNELFPVSYDFSMQSGSISDITANDALAAKNVEVNVIDGTAYVESVSLSRPNAFAHFTLDFGELDVPENTTVKIYGEGVCSGMSFDGKGDVTTTAGPIEVNSTDMYITLALPENRSITPTFEVMVDDVVYTGSLAAREWKPSEFVRKSDKVGVPVKMETEYHEVGAVGPIITSGGKKYRFTAGNLWYDTENDIWGIFESQAYFYNAGGLGNNNGIGSTPQYIGLFPWGATGLEDAQRPWFCRAYDYNTSTTYTGAYWPSTLGSSKNSTISNLWDFDYVYDWGRAYIEKGRDSKDTRHYKTPSLDDFKALMTGSFVQGCTVKGAGMNGEDITGIVCIPGYYNKLADVKTFINSVEGASCMSTMVNVNHNNTGNTLNYKYITLQSIEVLKELNDAVFFPAASKRNYGSDGKIYNSNGSGYYWSSKGGSTNGYALYFNGSSGGFAYNGSTNGSSMGRYHQMAVRLLVEVEE